MSRVLMACWLILVTSSTVAETIACQFVAAAGLTWQSGRWEAERFNPHNPFFLKVTPDGMSLNENEVLKALIKEERFRKNLKAKCIGQAVVTCTIFLTTDTSPVYELAFGPVLQIGLKSLQGAVATLSGYTSKQEPNEARDSLTVSPFICQKM